MPNANNIIWLASYPKSGNTWVRMLLANYLNVDNDLPIDINNINTSIISSSRHIFDDNVPFLSSDLTLEEIDNIRPKVYKNISDESLEYRFIKTHDAFTQASSGVDIFPEAVSKALIYIIRNPLDVAVSFAHHSNISIDKSIATLNNNGYAFSSNPKRLTSQLRQKLLTWSNHYLSWKNFNGPSLLIKYEDLIDNSEETFRKIVSFLYNEVDEARLKKAVEFSSFNQLKKQEKSDSFKEKPINAKSFFRKGISGSWRDELSKKQINEIINNHKAIMIELGYLNN